MYPRLTFDFRGITGVRTGVPGSKVFGLTRGITGGITGGTAGCITGTGVSSDAVSKGRKRDEISVGFRGTGLGPAESFNSTGVWSFPSRRGCLY